MPTATGARAAAVGAFSGVGEIYGRAKHENFTVASLVLGERNRVCLSAIYGFARLVDELGDAAPGDRLTLLDHAEQELDRAYAGRATEAVFLRLQDAFALRALPREQFVLLIDANRRDQRQPEYETYDDLVDYCRYSANPVGALVLHVFGAANEERLRLSDAVCTGLQLVEHWQDVGEDFRNGRIYLPREDRERFGVTDEQLGATAVAEPLRRLLAFETDRATELLHAGSRLVRSLRGRARWAVAGYVGGGRAAIGALEAANYEVLPAAPRASRTRRLLATVAVLGGAA
jgi:squalene synthase HpnC